MAFTGTLLVPIAIHAIFDLRLLALPPDFLEALEQQARAAEEPLLSTESTPTTQVQEAPRRRASSPAGWYRDSPQGEMLRWWDGTHWTDQTQMPQSRSSTSGSTICRSWPSQSKDVLGSALVIDKRYSFTCNDSDEHYRRGWSGDQPASICKVCGQLGNATGHHWEISLFGGRVVIPFNHVTYRRPRA